MSVCHVEKLFSPNMFEIAKKKESCLYAGFDNRTFAICKEVVVQILFILHGMGSVYSKAYIQKVTFTKGCQPTFFVCYIYIYFI